ncbi:MAG: ABC transporter permease [Saprospiraceae bacterium]|nr:ABC transporter permease [Saprospiraceae bacterium]
MYKKEISGPPRVFLQFFHWFCRPEYHPDIEGDLLELFELRRNEKNISYARWMLLFDIIALFRPSIIKPFSSFNPFNQPSMFRNNIKIAWRHLWKNSFVTLTNLSGLIIGMTAALFIWQYVYYERSYDTFHEKSDQIFRVRTERIKDGVPFMKFAAGTASAAPLLKDNFPQIENYVKLRGAPDAVFSSQKEKSLREDKAFFSMSSIVQIFSVPLLQGDPDSALDDPFTACISQSTALKLFGDTDPMGKTLHVNDDMEFKITGIFADIPANSHIKFNILLSYVTFSDVLNEGAPTETSATWDGYFSYLLLRPGSDWRQIESEIPAVIEKTYGEDMRKSLALYLQPVQDIHLTSHYLFEAEVNGNERTVQFLFLIGISVLLIAWFNYINLSTANSELRAKEVGVRKVLGGGQGKLIRQFLMEAILLNIFAIAFSLLLVRILHPFFESLIGSKIPLSLFSDSRLFGIILLILLGGTLLSGLYPAFVLSSFKPIQVLKTGRSGPATGKKILGKGLVTMQFVASVGLIVATLVINKQLKYLQEKKLGMEIDQTLIVKGPKVTDSTFVNKAQVFKQQTEQMASVKKLAASTSIPGKSFGWTAGGVHRLGTADDQSENFHVMAADVDYTELYSMELAAGRHMSDQMGSDGSIACLLNETGSTLLQFESPEDAIGEQIEFWGDRFTIVGVLKDFYQESPKSQIEPLVLRARPSQWGVDYYSIKIGTPNLSQSLAGIEGIWKNLFPEDPFEYFFLDDYFNAQYASEQRFSNVFTLFTSLAIFVSLPRTFRIGYLHYLSEEERDRSTPCIRCIGRKYCGAHIVGFSKTSRNCFCDCHPPILVCDATVVTRVCQSH